MANAIVSNGPVSQMVASFCPSILYIGKNSDQTGHTRRQLPFAQLFYLMIVICNNLHSHLHSLHINPAKKETPHSFKGQQLENKSLYRFVIYMGFLEKYLSYNLTLSL